ncbi:hypothetical protein J2P12_02980 [Candidatus Bathyarchaeota archaeon]|nr:hypothetical protein [Candidatus Bathyarchaeota archaeon]
MSASKQLPPVQLPPKVAAQLKSAVEDAFKSLGNEAAVLIMYYARSRHNVDMNDLPSSIEELDGVLTEVLGSARRMVVSQCATILSQRLGVDLPIRTEKLSDIFRQVARQYQKGSARTTGSPFDDLEGVEESADPVGADQ